MMKRNMMKTLLALVLCCTMCLSFAACGGAAEEEVDDTVTNMNYSTAGGSDITLPEGFAMPEEANKLVSTLSGDAYEGVVYLSSYRSSGYFFINGGSVTIDANLYLTDTNGEGVKTQYQDVKISLWQKGTNSATYVNTAHFTADGTNQTYVFDGLQAGGEYRFTVTYSAVGSYRVSGNFRVTSVSATGSEEETAAQE